MRFGEFEKHPELGNDYWADHPTYPWVDWAYEVSNDCTRLGYWDWVLYMIEQEEE